MKIDPKSPKFSIVYGVVVSLIALFISTLFDPFLKVPIFFIFYIAGFAFALYKGWTVLEYKKSESATKHDQEGAA